MITLNLEVLLIILLIIVNGIFSMSELAIVSAKKLRLQHLAKEGDTSAAAALELANDPNRFLSTIQIGITLVGVFTGAFGGATVAKELSALLSDIPALDPYSDLLGVGIVVFAITYLSLVIGELVPKRIALHNPEGIATLVSKPMKLLAKLGTPAVALLSVSTNLVLKLFGIRKTAESLMTEEDIRGLLQHGAETGVFEEIEHDMVERVLQLGDRPISSLMTPRNIVEAIDLEDTLEENLQRIRNTPHSIYPVCQGSLDHILGIINVKDLFLQLMTEEALEFSNALQQPVFIPEGLPAIKALETFQKTSKHIALVTDEYGIVQGLVTLTDILEGIVGDIPTEDELADLQTVQREDGSWLLDGMLPVDQFKDLLEIEADLPEEDKGNYQTLGGFIINRLEKIPVPADYFEWNHYRFEVVDMDGNRVDKVLVFSAEKSP